MPGGRSMVLFHIIPIMRRLPILLALLSLACAADSQTIPVHWLEGTPAMSTGATWGVPFPEGQYKKDATFDLQDGAGYLRLQSYVA